MVALPLLSSTSCGSFSSRDRVHEPEPFLVRKSAKSYVTDMTLSNKRLNAAPYTRPGRAGGNWIARYVSGHGARETWEAGDREDVWERRESDGKRMAFL